MSSKKSENQTIGKLRSPGLSELTLSLYKSLYLVLKFVPCTGQDDMGFDEYSKETFRSTAIDYAGAANFYPTIASILKGENSIEQIVFSLQCGSSATLTFEYKPEQDGHMGAYLVINKDNQTIPFRFETYQHQVYNANGQAVTKVIQLGLIAFAQILDSYIRYIRTNGYANKIPESPTPQAPQGSWNNVNF